MNIFTPPLPQNYLYRKNLAKTLPNGSKLLGRSLMFYFNYFLLFSHMKFLRKSKSRLLRLFHNYQHHININLLSATDLNRLEMSLLFVVQINKKLKISTSCLWDFCHSSRNMNEVKYNYFLQRIKKCIFKHKDYDTFIIPFFHSLCRLYSIGFELKTGYVPFSINCI